MTDKVDIYQLADTIRDAYHMSVDNSTLSEAAEEALIELLDEVSKTRIERDYFVNEEVEFYLGKTYSALEGAHTYAEIMDKMRKDLHHD